MGFEVMFVEVVEIMVLEEMDWTWEVDVADAGVEMGVADVGVLGAMGWTGELGVTEMGGIGVEGAGKVSVVEVGGIRAEVWVGGFAGFMGEGDDGVV